MNTDKITKGEWYVDKEQNHSLHIISSDNDTVVIATVYADPLEEEEKANAAYIVLACNLFHELLEVLEELGRWNKKYPPNRIYPYDMANTIQTELTEIISKAEELIQKAKQ